jgi:hypothetical protein
MTGTVAKAPDATWKYGTAQTAYPTSPTYGPGRYSPSGYPYCFQHTPEGALFMAAAFIEAGRHPGGPAYYAGPGPYHQQLIAGASASPTDDPAAARLQLAGFRVLQYDGTQATIDLAYQYSGTGQSVLGSLVMPLVWADGDWKISANQPDPVSTVKIPGLTGYISWIPQAG